MVDLQGKDKGNISLPPALQSPDMTDATVLELDEQPMIINMQRAMYKSLIRDLEQKIERLKTRNETLENLKEYVKNYSNNQHIQAEAVHVELNANIAFQTKKVDELKQKYKQLEEKRQEHIAEHEKKVKQMKENFEENRRRFSCEIKLLNAKINVLEDFKASEEALVSKLNSQNAYMVRKEEELEQALKDFEFKTKVHRENLKKETYKSVLDASQDFQSNLLKTIPLTVRMFRENIILENELNQCLHDHAIISEQKADHKKHFKEFHERIKENRSQTRRSLITSKIQSMLIDKLKIAHSIVANALSKSFQAPQNFEKEYQKFFDSANKSEFKDDDYNRRKLEVLLHQERIKLVQTNRFKSKTSFALNACRDALGIMKFAVNTAVLGEGEIVDVESFASYLLNIIEDCNSKKWIAPSESLETVELSSNIYAKGDLGFEPKHIEFEDEQLRKSVGVISSSSVASTLEILQELQKLQEKIPQEKRVSETQMHESISTEVSTSTKSDSTTSSAESVDDKQKAEKLKLLYDEIFSDDGLEYEMEHDYDYFTDYDQE